MYMANLRFDLVFSYWVYFWYLLYAFKFISFSPKFALLIGLFDNIIMFILMLVYGTRIKTILMFLFINTIIKIIPLYYLRNQDIRLKDIYFTVALFSAFVLWLHINNESLVGNAKYIHDSLLYDKGNTPFIAFVNKIKNNFKTL